MVFAAAKGAVGAQGQRGAEVSVLAVVLELPLRLLLPHMQLQLALLQRQAAGCFTRAAEAAAAVAAAEAAQVAAKAAVRVGPW